MSDFHTPVLLNEVIEYLVVQRGGKYIDATLGGGGHSARIIGLGAKVLSLDQDVDAVNHAITKFKTRNSKLKATIKSSRFGEIYQLAENWQIVKGNFADIEEIAQITGFTAAAGVLFDLGLSSHQLADETRGFSFNSDEELDMRMDKELGVKASVLVNGLTKKELEKIFLEYGEEQLAWKIAKEIVRVRQELPVRTCRQLSEICEKVKRGREGATGKRIHPATQVFQALRIVVNDELGSLEKGLKGAFNILQNKGRIVVISFHSLEDRIIKNKFRGWAEEGKGEMVTKKTITASEKEISVNPRARSAKMRVFEKV